MSRVAALKVCIDNLRKIAPGFKDDKDDDWVVYLSQSEQIKLRKWRQDLHRMIEQRDEIKLDMSADATQNEQKMTDIITSFIKNTLLVNLPRMKESAIRVREEKIQKDFSPASKRPRLYEPTVSSVDTEAEYLPFDFLPQAMLNNVIEKSATEPSQPQLDHESPYEFAQSAQDQANPQKSAEQPRDTYLDDVAESRKSILNALRPTIEKYNCKHRVLEALDSFERHDRTIICLRSARSLKDKAKEKRQVSAK